MNLEGIIAVSGQPGLYKQISTIKNGIIVESLTDKKRIPVYSNSKVSSLKDISVYGITEEIPLFAVFQSIYKKEEGKETISHKENNNVVKKYFAEIVPDYDEEKVYVSDMKKVLNWYNLLLKFNSAIFIDDEMKENEAIETEAKIQNNPDENESEIDTELIS